MKYHFLFLFFASLLLMILLQSSLCKLPGNSYATKSAAANYKEYCAGCHGRQLKSFVNRTWIYGNSWNEVYRSIKVGYPNEGMPAYDTTFTEKELSELTDYILKGIEDITAEELEESRDLGEVIQSKDLDFHVEKVVEGLDVPWGLAFLPDGSFLFTERPGGVFRFADGQVAEIEGTPQVKARGQGGMLDVAVHPDFEHNQWIYLSYSKPKPGNRGLATTAVMRAKL